MLQGATAESVYRNTLEWAETQGISESVLDYMRRAATDERPDYDGETIGWVLIALQGAFYQLLHARDFESALVDVVSAGGDTDTNAAITGALLAVLYGVESIPRSWLVSVRAFNERRFTRLLPPRRRES